MLDRGDEHKPQGGRLGLDRKKSSLWGGKPLEQGQGRLLPVREVFRAGLDKALRHLECSCFELEVGPVTSRGSSQSELLQFLIPSLELRGRGGLLASVPLVSESLQYLKAFTGFFVERVQLKVPFLMGDRRYDTANRWYWVSTKQLCFSSLYFSSLSVCEVESFGLAWKAL